MSSSSYFFTFLNALPIIMVATKKTSKPWEPAQRVSCTIFQSDDSNMSSKLTLIHVPVGNNPARIRLLIYLKGLEDQIDISTPADYGGMSSDAYRALNPQGKIPTLLLADGSALYESRVISAFLADKYRDSGPSLLAETPEAPPPTSANAKPPQPPPSPPPPQPPLPAPRF